MTDFNAPQMCLATAPDNAGFRTEFDHAIDALRADVLMAATFVTNDSRVRLHYQREIANTAAMLEQEVAAGRMSWAEAAERARTLRNDVMDTLRGRSSPVGRALAEQMKAQGLNRQTLLTRYTQRLFGEAASFSQLTPENQAQVYAEIVRASGRSNPTVNARMVRAARFGRGLMVLSIGVSVYNIAVADDPGEQAIEEGAIMGGGIAGGAAGGAAAGLVCGPGAPLCVTVGAFVGGALGAFGVSLFF